MKVCHVCAFQTVDDAELCPVCGAELAEDNGIEVGEEDLEIVINSPVLVATIDDPVTVEIFCDQLKENGILFTSDEPDLTSTMHIGFGGFYAGIDIFVDKNDLEKAQEIYNNLPDSFEIEDEFEEEE